MADFSGPKTKLLPMSAIAGMGRQTISDISPGYWFSALQPTTVVAPPGYKPRQFAFQPGANLIWQPKGGESPITYETLRALADSWDLLRLMIEHRKDELASIPWEIRRKKKPGETDKEKTRKNMDDPNVSALNKFFSKPDGIHDFATWMKMWVEDMLVLDSVALYLARDTSGKIASIHPLDGATINRMLTDQGITPPPPSVAYQQVVYGTPVWDFTTDDLIYYMRNERTNRRYGYSKVEQLLVTISIGLRRQEFQLQYYTSGNMPEAMVFLPSDMPMDRVKEVQDWFDTLFAGDLAKRRRLTFLPGYGAGDQAKPNVIFPKEVLLKDEMDVWLTQIAAYCIGVSAQPFMKMMNRASAQEANEAAEAGGLLPDKISVSGVVNSCLDKMGFGEDYEFIHQSQRELDVLKQAQADNLNVGKILTVNESREEKGLEPRSETNASILGTFTQNGFVPLDDPPFQSGGPGNDDDHEPDQTTTKSPKGPTDKAVRGLALRKAASTSSEVKIDPTRRSFTTRRAQRNIKLVLRRALQTQKKATVAQVKNKFTKLAKADINIKLDWSEVPDAILDDLIDVALDGADYGAGQLDTEAPEQGATEWAKARAAELVGLKWIADKLEENSDAKWSIALTTENQINLLLERAKEEGLSEAQTLELLEASDIFSSQRASRIAENEVDHAQAAGNLIAWQESDLIDEVDWVVSAIHQDIYDCRCSDNAAGSPYPIDQVPDFPDHNNCGCMLIARLS